MPSVKSVSNTHPRWNVLVEAVQADRVKLGYPKQAQFARFLGTDVSTVRVIEGRRAGKVSESMLDHLNHALGWPDGTWREHLGEQGNGNGSADPIRTASEVVLLQELLRRAEQRQRSVG